MLEVSAPINAPATVAWRLLTDTHAWPHWGPSVRAVDAPQRFINAGMRGRVQTTPGLWLPSTGHIVSSTGPDTCRITFTMPAWAPFYVPVCRTALTKLAELARAPQ